VQLARGGCAEPYRQQLVEILVSARGDTSHRERDDRAGREYGYPRDDDDGHHKQVTSHASSPRAQRPM
jgi:hypothetical protein